LKKYVRVIGSEKKVRVQSRDFLVLRRAQPCRHFEQGNSALDLSVLIHFDSGGS